MISITITIVAFEDKEQAQRVVDLLSDTFMDLPESDGVAMTATIVEGAE